jgi:hypothetical protein
MQGCPHPVARSAAGLRVSGRTTSDRRAEGSVPVPQLTRDKVVHIVGRSRVDDHAVAEIIRTGASETELVEAVNRVMRGGEVGAEKMRTGAPRVKAVCDILTTSIIDLSEPE